MTDRRHKTFAEKYSVWINIIVGIMAILSPVYTVGKFSESFNVMKKQVDMNTDRINKHDYDYSELSKRVEMNTNQNKNDAQNFKEIKEAMKKQDETTKQIAVDVSFLRGLFQASKIENKE